MSKQKANISTGTLGILFIANSTFQILSRTCGTQYDNSIVGNKEREKEERGKNRLRIR
jgi:hypothetical protein